jgi:hypothetical protein
MSSQPKLSPGFGDAKAGLNFATDRAGYRFEVKHVQYTEYNDKFKKKSICLHGLQPLNLG